MKYIELRPGININKDHIVSIEEVDMMSCKITTVVGVYESIYPSWRILMQVEQQEINEQPVPLQTPDNRVNLWGNQYWAG